MNFIAILKCDDILFFILGEYLRSLAPRLKVFSLSFLNRSPIKIFINIRQIKCKNGFIIFALKKRKANVSIDRSIHLKYSRYYVI